ncbi:Hsp20/alpha crystallin family protein [Thioalkalivibrio paradoxus]|uniref:Heat-shock protein n=1 Tax=Thioalkalivibrio paradoxus ARh 1 TaxID=713585 RepID=W0DNF4_9GAMM|nr:Hsp20/alpha crystallin family protein [Thioalkalivibrio paradoxus]AHE98410.1 heat-shock protein [Thioalkalivibrio paradoxus ARh 1]
MNERTRVAQQQERQAARSDTPEGTLMPPVDVFEEGTGITMYADLPGVSKEGLHLHVEADTLTIEGEVALNIPEDMEATHAEVSMPRYRRVFTLSRELDTDKVSAELRNGVLKLHIPKVEHAQPRRIDVQVA